MDKTKYETVKEIMKESLKVNTSIQLKSAVGLCGVGAGLLIAGFVVEPTGKIDSSVLVAFGEILTFVGALMGIDYRYKGPRPPNN